MDRSYNWREKSEKVIAMQVGHNMQIFDSAEAKWITIERHSWMVNTSRGQIFLTDAEFKRRYEPHI